jgi:hypothetical protein
MAAAVLGPLLPVVGPVPGFPHAAPWGQGGPPAPGVQFPPHGAVPQGHGVHSVPGMQGGMPRGFPGVPGEPSVPGVQGATENRPPEARADSAVPVSEGAASLGGPGRPSGGTSAGTHGAAGATGSGLHAGGALGGIRGPAAAAGPLPSARGGSARPLAAANIVTAGEAETMDTICRSNAQKADLVSAKYGSQHLRGEDSHTGRAINTESPCYEKLPYAQIETT